MENLGHPNLNLYDNAIDSIRHAVEHYTSDPNEARRYKYALQHLSQGVMLLLKERLRLEHPSLIFQNVAKADKTVDVDTVIVRLREIANIDLGMDEQLVRELAGIRNRIEHYALDVPKEQADSMISRSLPFIAGFVELHLNRSFASEIGQENWNQLLSITEYFERAVRAAKLTISEAQVPAAYFCEHCRVFTAIDVVPESLNEWQLTSHPIRCLVCRRAVLFRTFCRGCGISSVHEDAVASHFSYCPACANAALQRFPESDSVLSLFATEVWRWFQSHETVTTRELYSLLANVASLGPTGAPRLLSELHSKGYIGFAHSYDEARYIALRKLDYMFHGFPLDTEFVWKWSSSGNAGGNVSNV